MLDLLVTGGAVVTPTGVASIDIGVADGRIVTLQESGADRSSDAARIVDATGHLVVPGGIDPHVHTNWVVPTAAEAGISSFGPDRVSVAAAYGGTTTLVDFAFWRPGDTLQDAFDRKLGEWKSQSYVDYTFHGTFKEPEIPAEVLAEVPSAIQDGHASFKVWMTNTTPERPWQKTDIGHIWGLLEKTGEAGGIVCVHAEDDDIVMYEYKRHRREGRVSFEHVSEVHNSLSELLSFQRVITLAGYVGAPIYIMHVSAKEGVDAIRAARGRGQAVYGESLQHYAYFTEDDYRRKDGAVFHTYPSLKSAADRDAMWQGLVDGTLSTIATDEMCTDFETKTRGQTISDVTGGHAGVEVRMAVAYTEGVHKRGIPLTRFVDVTSANAARILGMYPRKGAIAIGSEADLVVLDRTPRTITADTLHESDYTPWEGYEAAAWPKVTMLRGSVVMDGDLAAGPSGQLVPQHVSAEVRARPSA